MELMQIESVLNSWMISATYLATVKLIARLKVHQIYKIQLLGVLRNDDIKGLIASFCPVNRY
jgi:hypothetical protein